MDRWDVMATLGVMLIAAGLWMVWGLVAVLFWVGLVCLLGAILGAR